PFHAPAGRSRDEEGARELVRSGHDEDAPGERVRPADDPGAGEARGRLGPFHADGLGALASRPAPRVVAGTADTMPGPGALAEWLGRGLHSLVRRFESARRLQPRDSGSRLCREP